MGSGPEGGRQTLGKKCPGARHHVHLKHGGQARGEWINIRILDSIDLSIKTNSLLALKTQPPRLEIKLKPKFLDIT